MFLFSPILDAFLNDNQSPEQLAETHNVTVREVLDLLLSDDATTILRRLEQAEELRQSVLAARARSKAFATLDYLTLADRHAHHKDCDSRRRVSEAILKQTSPTKPRASSASRAKALPVHVNPALIANAPELRSISHITAPDPLFLCGPPAFRPPRAQDSNSFRLSVETLQAAAGSMNPASCTAHSSRPTINAAPDDG